MLTIKDVKKKDMCKSPASGDRLHFSSFLRSTATQLFLCKPDVVNVKNIWGENNYHINAPDDFDSKYDDDDVEKDNYDDDDDWQSKQKLTKLWSRWPQKLQEELLRCKKPPGVDIIVSINCENYCACDKDETLTKTSRLPVASTMNPAIGGPRWKILCRCCLIWTF